MLHKINKLAIAIGAAGMLAASFVPAQAANEAGAFIGGLLLGGALAPRPYVAPPPGPGYVVPAPAPVYVPPRCYWTNQRYYDPYAGWVIRRVQVCN